MIDSNITYKRVYTDNGDFSHLELWQGGQHVEISLAAEGSHFNARRWEEIKKIVDNIQNISREEARKGDPIYKLKDKKETQE